MGVAGRTGGRVKLVASMIARNELGRYLEPCLRSLLEFCDEIRILDDASDEPGWPHALNGLGDRVVMRRLDQPTFFEHEGRARNALLDWTLEGRPTHVLAVDCDELVTNGAAVRAACETDQGAGSWSLVMEEVWKADARSLYTREDGGWRKHPVGVLWRVPPGRVAQSGAWRVADRKLACGREPLAVRRLRPLPISASILHMGWANVSERRARYQRYVEHDGGSFHARQHLDSIMWPDRKVRLRRRPWPEGLDVEAILARTAFVTSA